MFDWLNEQIEEHHVKSVRILGDITDAKDNHSAALTNRVTKSIISLRCKDVLIMAGNHDWLVKGQEFFRFLDHYPGITFVTQPTEDPDVKGPTCLYLPHSKNPMKDWGRFSFDAYDYVFMHQTIKGARASNGQEMDGEALPDMRGAGRVYSGDIHVPQQLREVTYIGSPYQVHFGDNFTPRVLLLDRDGRESWLHYPAPRRMALKVGSLRELKRIHLSPGDQVKFTLTVPPEEKHEWARLKREAIAILVDRGAFVRGAKLEIETAEGTTARERRRMLSMTPEDAVVQYVMKEELGYTALDEALEIMK